MIKMILKRLSFSDSCLGCRTMHGGHRTGGHDTGMDIEITGE